MIRVNLVLTTRQYGLLENAIINAIEKSDNNQINSPSEDLFNIAQQMNLDRTTLKELEKLVKE